MDGMKIQFLILKEVVTPKCVNLNAEKEPQIFSAIRFGTLLENTRFIEGTDVVDYENVSITENTRAAYPIHHIDNAVSPSIGGIPQKHIFPYLRCIWCITSHG